MDGIIDTIFGVIGVVLYNLFGIIFVIIDGIQDIFKAFAGTGEVHLDGVGIIKANNSGDETDTGLLYYLFQSDMIENILISIVLLALFLLIIFTAMAFLKSFYSQKPKKWQEIVGNAFIGLANFVFIPVCCLLGVWMGNILLNAIDGATNVNGAKSLSRMLFVACAYNANDIRAVNYDGTYEITSIQDMHDTATDFLEKNPVDGYKIEDKRNEDIEVARAYYAQVVDEIAARSDDFHPWSRIDTAFGYEVMDINYLALAAGGIFMIYVLAAISFGMVKRLFTLLMLYVISPAVCAYYPLDDGKAVGSWKQEFIKNTISAYGAVAGMNLFFCLLPIAQQINVGGVLGAMGLTSVLLTIAGLYVVKDFISTISGFFGAGNAYGDGAGLMSSTTKRVKQGAAWVGKRTKNTIGAFVKARAAAENGGSYGESLRNSMKEGASNALNALTGIDVVGAGKYIKDQQKAGEEEAAKYKTDAIKKQMKADISGGALETKDTGGVLHLDLSKLEDYFKQKELEGLSRDDVWKALKKGKGWSDDDLVEQKKSHSKYLSDEADRKEAEKMQRFEDKKRGNNDEQVTILSAERMSRANKAQEQGARQKSSLIRSDLASKRTALTADQQAKAGSAASGYNELSTEGLSGAALQQVEEWNKQVKALKKSNESYVAAKSKKEKEIARLGEEMETLVNSNTTLSGHAGVTSALATYKANKNQANLDALIAVIKAQLSPIP